MDRRETLKTLLVGTFAGVTLGTSACKTDTQSQGESTEKTDAPLYGRTPAELEHDLKVMGDTFFNTHELETIAVLCDIILPATSTAGSATDAKVPDFIEFIAKDLPDHQLPMRGGLMWLDGESNKRYNVVFKNANNTQQLAIVDDIAYPDEKGEKPEMAYGIRFFNRIRNLTLTGYYTTRMGLDDLGYQGNVANVWDGVPDDVLAKHGLAYEEAWLAKCVDQSKRDIVAQWDEDGNLIS